MDVEGAADVAEVAHTDRQVGRLISLGGTILILAQLPEVAAASTEFAPWWSVSCALLAAIVLLFALLGGVLPTRVLRVGWVLVPVLGWTLWLTTFAAFEGVDPSTWLAWPWVLQPVVASYPVLWTRPAVAAAVAVLAGCLPALSALLTLGHVPAALAVDTPIYLTNIMFVAIFAGIRARLNRLRHLEGQAREQDRLRARAVAEARRQEQLGRLIHDEVLSVLNAGLTLPGSPPAQLRAEATHALQLLEPRAPRDDAAQRPTGEALAAITASLRRIDPSCPVRAKAAEGSVPAHVVEEVTAAAAEALRNSIRHAGMDCRRGLGVRVAPREIRVVVHDDGPGFDPDTVDPARLGLRESVLARMSALEGGEALIRSSPGAGAEVVLTWRI